MRIGVVSDTHAHVTNTLAAVRMLQAMDVEVVLHCGDIGSPEVPPLFRSWPTHFVFGNVDHNQGELRAAIEEAGLSCHGRFADLRLGERRIALLHSDDIRRFDETVASGDWDLVCYGHTHQAKLERVGKTLVLNPGALYRARPHTIAVVDLAAMEAMHVTI